jgi:hypothetical protein
MHGNTSTHSWLHKQLSNNVITQWKNNGTAMPPFKNFSVLQLVHNLQKLITFLRDKIVLTHGVRLPKIVCTSLVQSSIWISPSVWFLAAKGYILMHSRLSTRQAYDRRVQWREIRGWRTIHVESLVSRHRWTDFYVCKSGLHCSKMFMLKCSWFFEYLNSYTFLLQTCIQYLRVCAPTLCAECKMPSVM